MKTKILSILVVIILNFSFVINQIEFHLFGGVTYDSFEVKLKTKEGGQVEVFIDENSRGTFSADSTNYYSIPIDSLNPSTTYNVELKHKTESRKFQVTTFPDLNTGGEPFTFAAGANVRSNTDSIIFNKIKSKNPDFFMLLGNIHNNQISTEDWKKYEEKYLKGK
jgi:hypothetical protein